MSCGTMIYEIASDALYRESAGKHQGRLVMTDWGIKFAARCELSRITGVPYEGVRDIDVDSVVDQARKWFIEKGAEVCRLPSNMAGLVFKGHRDRAMLLMHIER
jgi:hypothetical protein